MEMTQPVTWLGNPCLGYVVNAEFSPASQLTLAPLLNVIGEVFGETVHVMPLESLHITLLDWIAPLVDYDGQDKDILFTKIKTQYDAAMTTALTGQLPIQARFSKLLASPSTIYIQALDDGRFDAIRSNFVSHVDMLPGTKMPPNIIHTSLARFTGSLSMQTVQEKLDEIAVDFTEAVSSFRLIRSTREPLSDYVVLKTYT
jgi:hypothetical protein